MSIAIVGRGCVLPGALDPDALWQLAREGRDAIGPVPEGRWRLSNERALTSDPKSAIDRAWSDRGGYVRGDVFDPSGFAIDGLASLDPLFRWTMHAGREALREAGSFGAGKKSGLILGNLSFPTASHARFAERHWLGRGDQIDPRERFHSGLAASLTASALDLHGAPSFCLDAACASSLYAIALACEALEDRRADLMLAGAVNCTDDLFIHVGFCALDALSKTGRSRPFHPDADGLVPAEGAALVALMRTEDAAREGRRILGVIRGVGLANDGRAKSFLAPSEEGQARAMRAAYAKAGIAPSEISWIECHATGTPIGDATEIRSTARVFEGVREIAIGSLKANLGHLITTAGAAGLLKVLGAMEAGVRPPTPHLDRVSDAFDGTPLRVVTEAEPWTGPKRAAISAFGFGGNDAHLIVEAEHEQRASHARVAVPRAREPIAIVGIGVRAGALGSAKAFADALATGRGGRRAEEVTLPIEALRSPPADLASSLAQQTMLLAAVLDAASIELDPDRTAVLVGMQCDSEIARYGIRWRLPELAPELDAKDAFAPALKAAAVLGTMPNIPANRVNRELDVRGPSYTVSADELSGVRALEIAVRALRMNELDAALVGAVDLACEPVHESAAREVLDEARGGDAAVVLTLERLSDARAKGRAVLAVIDDAGEDAMRVDGRALTDRFGHAHAASGLLHVAAVAIALHRRASWLGVGRSALVEIEALGGQRATVSLRDDPSTPDGAFSLEARAIDRPLLLPAHPPIPRLASSEAGELLEEAPPLPRTEDVGAIVPREEENEQVIVPAPSLDAPRKERRPEPVIVSSVIGTSEAIAAHAPIRVSDRGAIAAELEAHQRRIAEMHAEFLKTQSALHTEFLAARERALSMLAGRGAIVATPPTPAPIARPERPEPIEAKKIEAPARPRPIEPPPTLHRARGLAPNTPPPAPIGRAFSRAELEVHASGRISEIFGATFAEQDRHAVQVRMPEPPLLLADRVTGITGEPGSMGKGSVWTETDVTQGAFYLHCGRMPAGVMIESGQADLFLISWLGADLWNRGERRYRLLGCKLTWHRSPPKIGETLRYDIHVDGHAKQGDVRLFFFHYDCHIDGAPALTVRSGQAGFFTNEELAESAGVLWTPEEMEIAVGARLDPPRVRCDTIFEDAQIEALTKGDAFACFGPGFEPTRTHVRTPSIAGGDMRFFDRVTCFDPSGGPHGRGYLKATASVSPDDWFFSGHFKNDPCMPGTLMLEGCLSAMAFYMIGTGAALDRDGWRFEPIPDETYDMICRGQVTRASRELTYELFVSELHDGPTPKLYADLLCTVDGRKAFHAKRLGLQLVPDHPMSSVKAIDDPHADIATLDGVRLDSSALLASAWGRPSAAFGPRYAEFDGTRRAPRLPGPPYHMVSRVTKIGGEPWAKKAGASVEIEYDVPPDAWYFADGASGAMPYSLLLEAALQPCGWLATYVGSTLGRTTDLRFRNLDGEGQVLAEVLPDAGSLRTRATLTSISDTASMVIVGFDVVTSQADREVYRLKTVFGFFPDAAFENQAGLPIDDAQRALLNASGNAIDLRGHSHLPTGRLALLDELSFFDPSGGRAGLGAARAETNVDPGAWFFKAHFFQDPVQPGSLGMEAMLSLLRVAMIEKGLTAHLREPRFAPIANEPHRWKYRGQVLPTDRRIAVTVELTSIDTNTDSVLVEAEASFWIDGKRIYEATIALEARSQTASFWDRHLGIGGTIAEDLHRALVRRFAPEVAIADRAAIAETPVLYVANHQTAIETLLFSTLIGEETGVPAITLAKAEHRTSWLGELLAWIFAHPRATERELTAYFDREDPAALPALLRSLRRDRSILVHVEGTRARSCRDRIERVSGVPIEIALERGMPIVPVRFSGALPIEPVPQKLDFPHAMAALDITIGAPIADLGALSYKDRIDRVREAIEALAPRDEAPNDGDLVFASEVARSMIERRLELPWAVLFCALREHEGSCEATRRLLTGGAFADDPIDRWHAAFAARLTGIR